jgi:prevent-host-death family protein
MHLSSLLTKVAAGDVVIITRSGELVARIVPIERQTGRRILGQDAGRVIIADDFDEPLDPKTMR